MELEDIMYDLLAAGYSRYDIETAFDNAEAAFLYGYAREEDDSVFTEFQLQELAQEEMADRMIQEDKLNGLL